MIKFLNSIIYGLTGTLSLLISIGAILYMGYYIFKNGFKFPLLIGIFLFACLSAYLITVPERIPQIGETIIKEIFENKDSVKG